MKKKFLLLSCLLLLVGCGKKEAVVTETPAETVDPLATIQTPFEREHMEAYDTVSRQDVEETEDFDRNKMGLISNKTETDILESTKMQEEAPAETEDPVEPVETVNTEDLLNALESMDKEKVLITDVLESFESADDALEWCKTHEVVYEGTNIDLNAYGTFRSEAMNETLITDEETPWDNGYFLYKADVTDMTFGDVTEDMTFAPEGTGSASFTPKAFVDINGTCYDLYAFKDDTKEQNLLGYMFKAVQ